MPKLGTALRWRFRYGADLYRGSSDDLDEGPRGVYRFREWSKAEKPLYEALEDPITEPKHALASFLFESSEEE